MTRDLSKLPHPFPNDTILYTSWRPEHDVNPHEDSWITISRLPDDARHVFGEHEHINTHRLTFHSPAKGDICHLINEIDAEILIKAMCHLINDEKPGRGMNTSWFHPELDWIVPDSEEGAA